jgi:DNA-binding IclR family transcriptional regulator
MEIMDSSGPHGTTAKDIAAALNAPNGTVNFSLARLAKQGKVKREEDGSYYAMKEAQ